VLFLLFQVAAHNPTGVDLTDGEWDRVLSLFKERKGDLFPVFDSAYQGLAKGLDEDVAIVRKFHKEGMEFIVCNSHSKNFGLYGERVGSCFVACESAEIASNVSSRCQLRIRWNYSVPPLFGARIVSAILGDAKLRAEWEQELAGETRPNQPSEAKNHMPYTSSSDHMPYTSSSDHMPYTSSLELVGAVPTDILVLISHDHDPNLAGAKAGK